MNELNHDLPDAERLYHIVLVMPKPGEWAGAVAERRIFTEFGDRAAKARMRWLKERNPGPNKVSIQLMPADNREPVC